MREPKQIVGVKVRSVKRYCHVRGGLPNAEVPREYEVLSADRGRVSLRVTEEGTWAGIADGVVQVAPGRVVWELSEDGTLRRDGAPVPQREADGIRWGMRDDALCAVLSELYGEEFTGYEHNYLYREGTAWAAEDGDPEA